MDLPRFMPKMKDADYRALPLISSSGIRTFASAGPWVYYHAYVLRSLPSKDTESKRRGSLLHFALDNIDDWQSRLYHEPETIEDDPVFQACLEQSDNPPDHFQIGEPINKRSPIHREYLAAHRERYCETPDGLIIVPGDIERVQQQIEAVYENPETRELIESEGHTECAAVNESHGTGIKCLIDRYLTSNVAVDWKTTQYHTANAFISHGKRLGYHFQAEWYQRVSECSDFIIVSITSNPPFEAMCYEMPKEVMAEAREANDFHLQSIIDCQLQDSWHSLYWGGRIPFDPTERLAQ